MRALGLGLCFAALLAGLATPALADELPGEFAQRKGVIKLQPSGPWALNFAEDKCILSRQFGDDDNRHLVFFEQSYPSNSFGMTLAGRGTRRFARGRWNYLGILNDVPMKHLSGDFRGEVDQFGHAIIMGDVFIGPELEEVDGQRPQPAPASIDLGQAAKIDRIVLKLGTSGLSFETGNMMPPLQALNVCTGDLLREWGLDPEKHHDYRPARWINEEDIVERIVRQYPRKAMYRGEQAIFRMRVIVETDGTVSDCHLEKSTDTEFLESPACEPMMKAMFEPALDSEGQPMRSFYATSINYIMN